MGKEDIFKLIVGNTCIVIPELKNHKFEYHHSLKELGANSVDRAEIVMMTMESLSLQIPRVEFSGAQNIGELVDIFYEKL